MGVLLRGECGSCSGESRGPRPGRGEHCCHCSEAQSRRAVVPGPGAPTAGGVGASPEPEIGGSAGVSWGLQGSHRVPGPQQCLRGAPTPWRPCPWALSPVFAVHGSSTPHPNSGFTAGSGPPPSQVEERLPAAQFPGRDCQLSLGSWQEESLERNEPQENKLVLKGAPGRLLERFC